MFVLLCFLACALAAPQPQWAQYMGNMGTFLDDLNKDMDQLGKTMAEVASELRRTTSGWQGNHYYINITLNGFGEQDIAVKASTGSVKVHAAHKSGNSENIFNLNDSLPYYVKADSGSWVYEGGVLKIVFPVDDKRSTTEIATAPIVFKNRVEFVSGRSRT